MQLGQQHAHMVGLQPLQRHRQAGRAAHQAAQRVGVERQRALGHAALHLQVLR
jgi:hypothetical protein